MTRQLPFIPYPSINDHGVTGDRRTAALVAADGTIDWMCLPDYDGDSIFGVLLDAQRGGFWRFGPQQAISGKQSYLDDSAALITTWTRDSWELELTDLMIWPQERRRDQDAGRRVILRRLRCTLGEARVEMQVCPRGDFDTPATVRQDDGGIVFEIGERKLGLWTSFPVEARQEDAAANFMMRRGDEAWAVLALGEAPSEWSLERARSAFEETVDFWNSWIGGLTYRGPRARSLQRSGLIVHMLGYAPEGSMVAAPTTSLPERIGGDRNYDYRFAWIRDASLSVAALSLLGDQKTASHYLDWLSSLKSSTEMPLQVVYHINGDTILRQHERRKLAGYRGSQPVLIGNHAYHQIQLGSLGYLADCMLIHLKQGGPWKQEYWDLLVRCATYITGHWHEKDNGIWEVAQMEQYVGSKVMSWVVLDRAITIGERTGHLEHLETWQKTRDTIFASVMEHGWSEEQQSFVQFYGGDNLDASLLLIPVMGFLPSNHPRVQATLDRVVEALAIDGLIYRFKPLATPGEDRIAMGQFEGAFLPCCFWLATAYAMDGRITEAEEALGRVESLTNAIGLFAEEADARSNEMLGNYPLLFSQVEYIRAVLALKAAREAVRR